MATPNAPNTTPDNPWEVASEAPAQAATQTQPPASDNPWQVASEAPAQRPDFAANPPAAAGPHVNMQPTFSGRPTGGTNYQAVSNEATPTGHAAAIQQREKEQPVLSVAGHAAIGYGKGAGALVGDVSHIVNKIPVVGETLAPKEGVTALQEGSKPEGTAEKVGYGAEQISEFLAGDEALKSLSVAQRLGVAEKLAKYAKTSPRLAAILGHGMQAMRQGTAAGVQSYVHGATPADALKTAGLATLLGTGTGAVMEGAGAAYRAVGNKFSPKYLQEPLQNGLHEVLEQTARDSNIGGPPPEMNYVNDETGKLGNMQHRISTVNPETGEDVGMLEAQNTRPDTVTVRSNQVPDPANRGRGYGQAQIQRLLKETQASGKKFVQSDISTTPDAQRAWRALEADNPDAITSKEFKPKAVEGQPEPLGSKTQWTVDLSKYQAPPNEPLAASALKRPASVRDAAGDMGDRVLAESKADYQALDEATNGRFQRFRDRLEANRKKLSNLTDSEEDRQTEASILKNQKETEDAMNDAFTEAKAKGVDPKLINRADANFKKSQALYDLDTAVKRSTTGARPGMSHPDLVAEHPETVDPKAFHKRINAMYDSGRLQDALGEEGANKLFDNTLEHSGAYSKVMRNRQIALYAGRAAGTVAGLGALGHYVLPAMMGGHGEK